MMMLAEIISKIDQRKSDRERLIKEHKAAIESVDSELRDLRTKLAISNSGLNISTIDLARKVLSIGGVYQPTQGRDSVVSSAISDLAAGCQHMAKRFHGVKIYSGFGEQRCDCEYGYGPRHGSIVFSVGLLNPRTELTDEERDAAIYYLLNIKAVTEAEQKAKVAA